VLNNRTPPQEKMQRQTSEREEAFAWA